MLECRSCGGRLDLSMSACPACGAQIDLGRLTGILGVVCRGCDAYNDPGAKTCASCGQPLGAIGEPEPPAAPATPAEPANAPASPSLASSSPPDAAAGRPFSGGGGAQTRFVRFVPPAAPSAPDLTPIPLATHCPRCGDETGPGQFCARCGQPLGARGTQAVGRPAAPRAHPVTEVLAAPGSGRPRLVLERGAGKEGAVFRIGADPLLAGRAPGALAFPSDPSLAAHHATFFQRDGILHVRDEGAPGGVYVRLRGLSVPLRDGDLFVVGDRLLRYGGALPAPPAAPPDGTRRLGAPRPPGVAVVLEERLEGAIPGRTFVRGGPSITIGRAGCAVNLGDDPFLSQAHAEIVVDRAGGARLRDLGSSNGTFVRLAPRAERPLRDGDGIRLGREVLRVSFA